MTAPRSRRLAGAIAFAIAALLGLGASVLPAAAHDRNGGWGNGHGDHHRRGPQQFTNTVFVNGATMSHPGPNGPEAISLPDDITYLGGHIFVGFQNGVGPQGQASTTGNKDSTIVEFNLEGKNVKQWDVVGKCDGLTADPERTGDRDGQRGREFEPLPDRPERERGPLPLQRPPGFPRWDGRDRDLPRDDPDQRLRSRHDRRGRPAADLPGRLPGRARSATDVATVHALFYDEDSATVANRDSAQFGQSVSLALTDPDSNEDVPYYARRFAGDFMLTSQGDMQQIFVHDAGTPRQRLSVLNLSDSVDDTAWPSDRHGAIFTTDNSNDTINEIRGPFDPGQVFVADTPCDANDAPSMCPGPGFPPNFLGELDPYTGAITQVNVQGPTFEPQGMLFLP